MTDAINRPSDGLNRDAMEREATGGGSLASSFSALQQSDMAAATTDAYIDAADTVTPVETRALTRDLLALVSIFLIIATFHIQNPLLQFETPFGRAFRNPSLQTVVTLSMVLVLGLLVWATRTLTPSPSPSGRGETSSRFWGFADLTGSRRKPADQISRSPRPEGEGSGVRVISSSLRTFAIIVLVLYAAYMLLANVVHLHPIGTLLGIDGAVFLDEVEDEALRPLLTQALTLSMVLEYVVIAAVVALWQPWTRVALYAKALKAQLAPLGVAVLVLVLWEVLIIVSGIGEFLLPRPSVIGAAFLETYPRLVSAAWMTFQNAFWGFAFGCGAGILIGIVAARFVSFSKALLPIAIAVNAIPIIALAPIFNNWFGVLNPTSKIAIVAVLVFFPAMISTVRGLTSADPLSLELMRSYAAGNWAIFRKLRLPMALPFIFSALKVATTLSTIGAIVSEYFGGSTAGLGYRIRDDAGLFKYPEAWAAILMASLAGILFYLVVSAVERALLSWHVSFREK